MPRFVSRRLVSGSLWAALAIALGTGSAHAQNLFVSSDSDHDIVQIAGPNATDAGQSMGVFVASGGAAGLQNPQGLAFGPDRNLYVSDYTTNRILRYDGATGAFLNVYAGANNADTSGENTLVQPVDLQTGRSVPTKRTRDRSPYRRMAQGT